ncbi:MAG: hypothetical protein HY726_15970 [Candidatus Rokubacteria bacterium]|nr:hypothetical protein [Candidatus Rokubacteria bacterium]
MTGKEFATQLEGLGHDFFAGVPCSLIEGVLDALEHHPRLPYLAAVREDVAVGLAAGAWLGGKRPVVLLQNSGLGTGLNALASLALLYKLPSLLVVSWRGYRGVDAPEHLLTGAITPQLLDLLGIRHRTLSATSIAADLVWATREAGERMEPVAVLVPPGVLEAGAATEAPGGRAEVKVAPRASRPHAEPPAELVPVLSRYEALRVALGCLSGEPVIHANGYICRESHAVADRQQNFYMIGSMGLAAAIGLGLAVARPRVKPVIFDGDGNLLMSLGILPMVGALAPPNFVHVVFDNEVYGSTGNQASLSREVRLDRLAAAAGYRTSRAATTATEIGLAMRAALAEPGPHFILLKVTAHEEPAPRIPYPPEAIRDRFRASLGAS